MATLRLDKLLVNSTIEDSMHLIQENFCLKQDIEELNERIQVLELQLCEVYSWK